MQNKFWKQTGNTTLIALTVGILLLIAIGVVGIVKMRNKAAGTDDSAMHQQVMMSPEATAGANMATGSATPTTGTSDAQINADINALDQKMTKLNTDVSQSQAVPTEPPMSQ